MKYRAIIAGLLTPIMLIPSVACTGSVGTNETLGEETTVQVIGSDTQSDIPETESETESETTTAPVDPGDSDRLSEEQPPLQAVYHVPGSDFYSQSLPIGNGFMGASVFGGVASERLLLNEQSIWSGGPGANANYNGGMGKASAETNRNNLQIIRDYLSKQYQEFVGSYTPGVGVENTQDYPSKSAYINNLFNSLWGDYSNFGSYQEFGSMYIDDFDASKQLVVSGVENQQQCVEMLFDGDVSTKWYSPTSPTPEEPMYVAIGFSSEVSVKSYSITSAEDVSSRDPLAWVLMGSNDGESWTEVDSRTREAFIRRNQERTFELSRSHTYRYWKLVINRTRGTDGTQMAELNFYDDNGEQIYFWPEDYSRTLDLDNATVRVQYTQSGVAFEREYFVSNPDMVTVARLTSNQAGALNKIIRFDSNQSSIQVTAEENTITITGHPADHKEDERLEFAGQIKVVTDGTLRAVEKTLVIENATQIEIYVTIATNYQQCMDDTFDYLSDIDPLEIVKSRLAALEGKSYDEIKAAHVQDYQALYNRVKLNLGATSLPDKTTDELFQGYEDGTNTDSENRYLETLYYQFGRYLLISSSREGSLPANLQGIWAEGINPPWYADYHTNINIQMNYWLAEQTNLSECHTPMLQYTGSLVERGKITAYLYHGTPNGGDVRGWTVYHASNIWGHAGPGASYAFYFPAAAAWLCQHMWDRYAFTLDKAELDNYYEIMKGAALFWVDNLMTDPVSGKLVSSPSWSPEHGPLTPGASSDQTIIWELFNNVLKAAAVLGDDSSEIEEIRVAQNNLLLPQIGVNGQYMEWIIETKTDVLGDNGHRHTNHLYALHPGTLVIPGRSEADDAAAEAIKVTLNTRGDGVSEGAGWSAAWKINFWARLRDGNRAHSLLNALLINGTHDNVFNADHTVMQIDGNFGATAGMTEMFLQSHGDSIDLLPALPTTWNGSFVSGLRARGNVEVDIWSDDDGRLSKAILRPESDHAALKVCSNGLANYRVTTADGEIVSTTVEGNDTLFFAVVAGQTYILQPATEE